MNLILDKAQLNRDERKARFLFEGIMYLIGTM